jgi:Secretion system C-terminal sorting domain
MFVSLPRKISIILFFCTLFYFSQSQAQPKATWPGITIKQLCGVGANTVRIKQDPASGNLYIVQNNGIIQRVNFGADSAATLSEVYNTSNTHLNAPLGITFGPDGTMYLVGNDSTGIIGTATVVKGVPVTPGSENRTWSMIAITEPYPYGNIYNHRVNAIILNPTGDSLIINSGAATDHGEMHNGTREVGLTDCFWEIPIDGDSITLPDDRDSLRTEGYIFADGNRNTFDLAYNGNGDLIGPENSDDRDDPEELNWIREGYHYGFPWRIGGDNTPQQWTPYDPTKDPLLSKNAWGGGDLYVTYSNDPTYPQRPDSLVLTEPIPNFGPDADHFRDTTTGQVKDASDLDTSITSFTPHRSMDGIVIDRDSILAGDLKGGAFIISFSNSSLITALGDTSQDLVLVSLTKTNGNYIAHTHRLVSGFNSPLGIEMVRNKLFVVETGLQYSNNSPKLWEITLPLASTTGVPKNDQSSPGQFRLDQNYPNPFNPTTVIGYHVPVRSDVTLKVFDILGREIATLVNEEKNAGLYKVTFDGSRFSSGVYFYRIQAGAFVAMKKFVLMK